jgi:acyl dehydratase
VTTQASHPVAARTGDDTYFEDFVAGDVMRHARGKTVTEMDGVLLCNLAMNTASGHFDEQLMADSAAGQRIVFGGISAALVVGLATQDTAENAIRELGIDRITFAVPVLHGDTLYAYTEVVSAEPGDDDGGTVTFRHWGVNQRDEVVLELQRRVLIRRRPGGRR